MATKLGLYNEALVEHIGDRRLATLAEDREPRRVLDDIWDNGLPGYCLEQGAWKFAKRSAYITYDATVEPEFGYAYAFPKPTDFVKITKLCSDEYMRQPLLQYTEEGGYFFSDNQEIYLEYISNDVTYGMDLSLWPETFTKYVASALAFRSCRRLGQSKAMKEDIGKEMHKLLIDARSKDAIQGPTEHLPAGGWVRSRSSGTTIRDRGSKQSLLG